MFAVQFAMQSTHRKNQQAYAYNSIGEIECRRLGAHLSFCHHQQLGHFRALAGAEVLLHLELLLQLEDLAAREGGPRLLLPPGVRGARVGVVLRGLQSTVGAARIGVLMLGLGAAAGELFVASSLSRIRLSLLPVGLMSGGWATAAAAEGDIFFFLAAGLPEDSARNRIRR